MKNFYIQLNVSPLNCIVLINKFSYSTCKKNYGRWSNQGILKSNFDFQNNDLAEDMLQPAVITALFTNYHQLHNRTLNFAKCITERYYSKQNKLKEYTKCYKILEIPDGSDQECVRKAFIDLCKKYHPDSGNSSADALKFQEIESAYRTLQNKFAEERWNINEGIGEYGLYYKEKKEKEFKEKPEIFDINHTAPQHRQYLSYDGIGSGTPAQREKQYAKYKATVAAQNVVDHQIKKLSWNVESTQSSLLKKDKREAKKIKTRYGIDRLVEDLIQESMANGHFDNLKGQGKPLPNSNYNPYVDFVTHKMNEILIDNGFTPEWIMLQKEISDEIQQIKGKLAMERGELGVLPLNFLEEKKWSQAIQNVSERVKKLNRKINKYNLVVPMLEKQKLYFNLERESCDILKYGNHCRKPLVKEEKYEKKEVKQDVFSVLFSFFK